MNELINFIDSAYEEPNELPDRLQMYFGEPYKITSRITIKQPSLQDVIEVGEAEFYSTLMRIIGNTTYFRLFLWDCQLDWNKIRDFDLFRLWVKLDAFGNGVINVFLDGVDFSLFEEYTYLPVEEREKPEDEQRWQTILYDSTNNIVITERIYKKMVLYLRTMFNIFPKVEKTRGKTTKQWLINEDRDIASRKSNESEKVKSTLQPLISFCLNHPGFKYKKSELREVCFAEFMDSVSRLQNYEISKAALGGSYSGFVDTSKLDKEIFDFTRDLSNQKSKSQSSNTKETKAFSSLKKDDGTLKNKEF